MLAIDANFKRSTTVAHHAGSATVFVERNGYEVFEALTQNPRFRWL